MSKKTIIRSEAIVQAVSLASKLPPLDPHIERKPRGSAAVAAQDAHRRKMHLDELELEAKQKGFASGYAEGAEKGMIEGREIGAAKAHAELEVACSEEHGEFISGLEESLASVEFAMRKWFDEAEKSLGRLAVEIAEKLIHQSLTAEPESVIAIVRAALAEALGATEVRIRINPFVAGAIKSRKQELMAIVGTAKSIDIVEDPNLEYGCAIESDLGKVDANLVNILGRIAGSVKEAA